jgi:glyoxalase family protein
MLKLRGIHHITAIATDPQRNVDFYTQLLGLRLVKRTVNFDDPANYHLYFGDRVGSPGTIVTFFPWPGARRGSRGTGQVVATSFAVRPDAIDFWKRRLHDQHVLAEETAARFGRRVLRFSDPDGLMLELIESEHFGASQIQKSDVPNNFALHGFNAPTLEVQLAKLTEQLLIGTFGFEMISEERGRRRFSLNPNLPDAHIDLVERPDVGTGNISAGTVHHIAFRAADEHEQLQWRSLLEEIGLAVTPVIDRQYFHSIYFREPGGILFEIATDEPGFATDESVEHLGEALKLPPQYEEHRGSIERVLPPLELPIPSAS